MIRAVLGIAGLVACMAACKERGTITIDLSLGSCPATPTLVRVQVIKDGSCSACDSACECMCGSGADQQQCIAGVPCSGIEECPIEDARANGIAFDPPSAGRYAIMYQFLDGTAGTAKLPVAVVCAFVDVDADGTASSVAMPEPTTCCVPH